jgi:hypothetical protein
MESRSYTGSAAAAMHDGITIRRALPADASALEELAALDEAKPLAGDVIVAVVDGRIWAARSLEHARLVSDPFRPTAEARALLELRAAHVERAAGGRSLARRVRRRLPALG